LVQYTLLEIYMVSVLSWVLFGVLDIVTGKTSGLGRKLPSNRDTYDFYLITKILSYELQKIITFSKYRRPLIMFSVLEAPPFQ